MLQWVKIVNGRLALRGKPGRAFFEELPFLDCSRIVTLLSEREGGLEIGNKVMSLGTAWTWLPLENGQYPTAKSHEMLRDSLPLLSDFLDQGESILIHCAAGIHRTGMLAYTLLRFKAYSPTEALNTIAEMRSHTREGLQPIHLQWGEDVLQELSSHR